MRDAIVLSGWTWEAFNVPERLTLALARAGSRILYCENPVSFIRRTRALAEVEKGVFAFRPKFLSHRLNRFPLFLRSQSVALADQILSEAANLSLVNPLFFYPHGDYCLTLCREFKKRGLGLIHVCMDYELPINTEHARQSDLTLAIPRVAFDELREQFGDKIRLLPQFSSDDGSDPVPREATCEPAELSKIPRPRLGYLGNLTGRVSLPLLREILSKHPNWHFLSFEANKWLPLPNEHVLPWRSRDGLSCILDGLDIGFMPYDCADPKNLHCAPLKLFDYFARGIPVVSTPIVYVREYEDLVYTGSTADQLAQAISLALAEPVDSPKKAKRRAVAREHSLDHVSRYLVQVLAESNF